LVIVTITIIILYYFIVKATCGGFSSLITRGICCQALLLGEAIILENSVAKKYKQPFSWPNANGY
jgi:hypothetical protein